jgi:hypothetical protein
MHARFFRSIAAVLVALAASACGGIANPSSNQTETFTGIIQPGGNAGAHPFTASKSGEITVTVTNMNPTWNGYLSVAWLGAGCSGLIQPNEFTLVGRSAIAGPISKGSYCIAMFDSGFLLPEQYTITVSHP